MTSVVLLLVTAVLASSVHGFPSEDELFVDVQSTGETFFASASNASAAAAIMHMNRAEEQSGCTRTAGPYGGGGGGAFHEFIDGCHAIVRKIIIRSGSLIDAIQVTYKKRNGRLYTSRQRGGNGGGKHSIYLRRGEIIVGIFGKTGRLVDQLGFVTNHGRIFGPYGGNGGGSFKVHGCHLRGIFGRSGSLIDSIGFYCSSVPKCPLG